MGYTIFIFRRDLRLIDNTGLNYAMSNYENIIPIFIFTPEQVTNTNTYRSENAIQFMIESLVELNDELVQKDLRLYMFTGDNLTVLENIFTQLTVDNVIFNMDYTPYAIKRDKSIHQLCDKHNINCSQIEDYLLREIGVMNKKDGEPYTVFTPFKNNGLKIPIEKPSKQRIKNIVKIKLENAKGPIKHKMNKNILVHGGRKAGLKRLLKIKEHNNYDDNRNMLSEPTSLLSAYIKFGCISIREVYWMIRDELGINSQLLAQIFWREFYYYIAYYYPHVLRGKNFNPKYDNIVWKWSKKHFNAWCTGNTGYPIVDAGIRELLHTGYMHNRARLITSNFLNRILGMDWRHGEQYFAQKLTDYDPAVNNGNWGWISSTGTDPKPYFQRLFNPWLQSKKYDPDAEYIKKWLPNLQNIPANELHNWEKHYNHYDLSDIQYCKPIVDYVTARKLSIEQYRKAIK